MKEPYRTPTEEELDDAKYQRTEDEQIKYLAELFIEGILSHYKKEMGLKEEDEIDINFAE